MNNERAKIVGELLEKGKAETGSERMMIGQSLDYRAFSTTGIPRDSEVVKELESQGFKVIFPAELPEEKLNRMSEARRREYELMKNSPKVIDMQSKEILSMDFADEIIEHYNKFGETSYMGYEEGNVGRTFIGSDFDQAQLQEIMDILASIGFQVKQSEIGKNGIDIQADEPRRCEPPRYNNFELSKEDYESIADGVDYEKAEETFSELKDLQQQEKVVDKEENEEEK